MEGVFVTGTDTDVGKTVAAGGLLKLLHGYRRVAYWKPVQTGTVVGDDTRTLRELTQLPEDCFLPPVHRFPDALSPHLAAANWKKAISLDALAAAGDEHGREREFLVVEGAGGVLVPLNDTDRVADLIARLDLPAVVVAADRLGAINHTLLTLEALRARRVAVAGVVLMKSAEGDRWGNADAIVRFGAAEVLARVPEFPDGRSALNWISAHEGLRGRFHVPVVPL